MDKVIFIFEIFHYYYIKLYIKCVSMCVYLVNVIWILKFGIIIGMILEILIFGIWIIRSEYLGIEYMKIGYLDILNIRIFRI